MKRITQFARMICLVVLVLGSLTARTLADSTGAPALVISQFKITTGGQFFTLYNASSTALNMSNFELEYFNNYDLTKATSSKLVSLSGSLPAHGYFMVSDDSTLLCFQQTVDSVSLGLSSTAGLVELVGFSQSAPGSSVLPQLEDYVAWSKTAAKGAQTLPTVTNAFLQRQPLDAQGNPSVSVPGGGSWQSVQPGSTNPCQLVTTTTTHQVVTAGSSQLLPPTEPPATIVSLASVTTEQTGGVPAADNGLMSPVVTELLPNPTGTGTDSTAEFIELYNPNSTSFDLSGFELQAGTTVLHKYFFPGGASLPAHSFKAFYSAATKLSLSNTAGQVKLLDPTGKTISSSDSYGKADDGQAWALANGQWYWTTTPSPNAANIINQAGSTQSSTKPTSTGGQVKGASTTQPSAAISNSTVATNSAAVVRPIHLWTLALVAGLALLYGAYEYRADLANYFHGRRRNARAGRANRS